MPKAWEKDLTEAKDAIQAMVQEKHVELSTRMDEIIAQFVLFQQAIQASLEQVVQRMEHTSLEMHQELADVVYQSIAEGSSQDPSPALPALAENEVVINDLPNPQSEASVPPSIL